MSNDVSKSIPSRGSGEENAENRRIHEVADELRRRCQLYEAQLRDGQNDVSHLEVEQRVSSSRGDRHAASRGDRHAVRFIKPSVSI